MRIVNLTRNTIIAEKAEIANTFLKRLVGLLGRKKFKAGEALIFKNVSCVHTFGMRFAIDVLFVNRKGMVVAALPNLKPFRISGIYPFCNVIELPVGTIQKTKTQKGDLLGDVSL
ncbi:MAG: DUF192 domain-containing protein [Candidatus Omnitrophica bacterium]|nr:DUF192 domain-containing protein [Candidatus Omnitrophota bacterium]MCM8770850.1 DUF192 domain-containing protein [Candidatus Omnitrophota bacterium]